MPRSTRRSEACNICAEYRFDYYGAWSSLVRAWAIAESGQLDEGLAAYDAALEEFRRTGRGSSDFASSRPAGRVPWQVRKGFGRASVHR